MHIKVKYIKCSLIIILGLFVLCACQKKWKKPADVYFDFQLTPGSSSGPISFLNGAINLSKISFTGERSKGQKYISLIQDLTGNGPVTLLNDVTPSSIKFSIPQGTYSLFNLELEADNQTGTSFLVNAIYNDTTNNDTVLVQLQIEDHAVMDFVGVNSNGTSEILLKEKYPSRVTIQLNPNYWFTSITEDLLNDSDKDFDNQDSLIVISKTKNINLYNLIISRVNEGNKAVVD